jgi:hypothetical protein
MINDESFYKAWVFIIRAACLYKTGNLGIHKLCNKNFFMLSNLGISMSPTNRNRDEESRRYHLSAPHIPSIFMRS